jgi:hypothetical protein
VKIWSAVTSRGGGAHHMRLIFDHALPPVKL